MSDIFISYAREDQQRAEMLAQLLGGRGWSIFWDRTIPIGKTWRETIGSELDDACCIIVLWSKISIKSAWVQDEADEAKRRGVLVPILIENVQPPMGFRGIQAAHLENWDGTESTQAFGRLIADLAALIGLPPKETEKEGGQVAEAETAVTKAVEEPFGYLASRFGLSPLAEAETRRKAEKEKREPQSVSSSPQASRTATPERRLEHVSSEQPKTASLSIVPWRIIASSATILSVTAIIAVAVWRLGPSVTPQPAPSTTSQPAPPVKQPAPPITAQPSFPALTGWVVDAANLLTPEAEARLEAKLKTHEEKTSDQVVVVTVPSLGELSIENYANNLFNSWGFGQRDKNNGALLLIAPKEHKLRIEVGYGLEGTLTNAASSTILNAVITPKFQHGDFAGGVEAGVDQMLAILDAGSQMRAKAREYQKAADNGDVDAMVNLGDLYANGQGMADYAMAGEWYQKAADNGDANGMWGLGWLYEHGQGVAQDYAKAREWYQKAADKGNLGAKARLKQLPNR